MSESTLPWPDFLVSRGASPAPDGSPDTVVFPMPLQAQSGFLAPLSHLGLIRASGEDAENFLHNQLTNDVIGLHAAHAQLAGYCSPKGRLLATLLTWKDDAGILLALPRELLPATMKRLQMFVLRAKVRLEDAGDQIALVGIALPAGSAALPAGTPWQRSTIDGGTLIRMPDAHGLQRGLWAGPVASATAFWTGHAASVPAAPAALWRWTEILAGLPQVVNATREQFVPQMINFELVGGVNFRKGCYPGQEIVARSQYLGKLKRRTLLAFCDDAAAHDAATQAGTEVFSDADPDQPCGMIVNAEHGPDGRIACLVELKMEASGTPLHIGAPGGPKLSLGELPYSLSSPE